MATERTLDQHIEITSGIAAGKPRIAGRRITVQNIVIWHEWLDLSADEIATDFGLSLSDVYAALAYYFDHRGEIDASIQADNSLVEELKKITPSKIPEKLRARED